MSILEVASNIFKFRYFPFGILIVYSISQQTPRNRKILIVDIWNTCFSFYKHSVLNLRLEYASVFHKSSLKICLKYAYLRTLKRGNFHDLTQAWTKGVCKGYEYKEILKFLLSRLLK